jgi:putative flippase GtrA
MAVGLLNTIIGLSVIYSAMFFFAAGPFLSNAIGYAIGLVVGYFLNQRWTFGSGRHNTISIVMYICVIAFAYLVNMAVVYVAIKYLYVNQYVAQLPGMISYTAIAYIGCSKFVFNKSSSNAAGH